jgi:hypothetical protein
MKAIQAGQAIVLLQGAKVSLDDGSFFTAAGEKQAQMDSAVMTAYLGLEIREVLTVGRVSMQIVPTKPDMVSGFLLPLSQFRSF